jgi:hypothetical protein
MFRLARLAAVLGAAVALSVPAAGAQAQAGQPMAGRSMDLGLYTPGNETGNFSADQAWPVAPSQWLEHNRWATCGFPTSYAQSAIPGATTTLKSYWPGSAYVGMVGLDGYDNASGFDYFQDGNYVLGSAAQAAFAKAWPT